MNLEHANITVNSIDAATRFLQIAFPEVKVRGEGPRQQGGFWRHIGTENHYIALQQEETPTDSNRTVYVDNGINHIGFVVANVEAVRQRLENGGYKGNAMGVEETGRTSIYFYDDTGIEWEFVQYHSDDIAIKNSYK